MEKLREVYEALRGNVLALRDAPDGVWTGKLASSALGTALAVSALAAGDGADLALAEAGVAWLSVHANADGGWGDTTESVSNLSTTLIAHTALRGFYSVRTGAQAWKAANPALVVSRSAEWIRQRTGTMEPGTIARALRDVYGGDRTFAVPILAYLAMCGEEDAVWLKVPPLPFLLALLPQRTYRFFRMQVVSYALPALIAVGLCRHVLVARARGRFAWGRLFAGPLLRKLANLQPEHGGFLDAIPLTAFVVLSLRHAGYGKHAVSRRGLSFLRQAVRPDGSWAIDSNLRTWVTSLAVRSLLAEGSGLPGSFPEAEPVASWFIATQHKSRHPFTGASPGGWAWTDLPGGVPDADDTAGALIALKLLKKAGCRTDMAAAVSKGVRWLLDVQNADGGIPTFCRGWGRLPFDRSCPDISAHTLAALTIWLEELSREGGATRRLVSRLRESIDRLLAYLVRAQAVDGSWSALWFGHQDSGGGQNPVVGTARVVDALRILDTGNRNLRGGESMLRKGERWLVAQQHADGGWSAGKTPTVEETAWAVTALTGGAGACAEAVRRGCGWLVAQGKEGCDHPAPIGLYFSLLWYHEKLYPMVWSLEALARNR